MEMQFAAKGVSCTVCNRYLPVECVETQCNSICDSQTRTFWQQDRLSKTEEQLICVIYMYTHTHRETSSRAYVCMQVECTRQKSVKCFCCAPCSSSNSSPAIIVSKYPTASTNRNQSYDSIPQPPLHLLRKPQQWLRFICSAKCKGQSKKTKAKKKR